MFKQFLGVLASVVIAFAIGGIAHADSGAISAVTVSSCGSASYTAGLPFAVVQDTTGKLCTSGSGGGGGSTSGGANSALFSPTSATSNASLSVTTTTSNVALPTGSFIVVTNSGTTNAYFALGVGAGTTATTSAQFIAAGSSLVISVGSNTYLAGITAAGTTTLNIAGGSITLNGASTAALQSNVQSAPGTAASTAITVQGNASSIPVPVSVGGTPYYNFTSTGSVYVTGINTTTPTGFTAPATSTVCFIYNEGASGRYRVDGTNPTLSVGVPLNNYDTQGAFLALTSNQFTAFHEVAQSGTLAFVADCYK